MASSRAPRSCNTGALSTILLSGIFYKPNYITQRAWRLASHSPVTRYCTCFDSLNTDVLQTDNWLLKVVICKVQNSYIKLHHHTTTTVLRPFFRDHIRKPVPEENFWTLCCNGRLTEADTATIWLGATPSRPRVPTSICHPPCFLQAGCPSSHPTNSVKALKALANSCSGNMKTVRHTNESKNDCEQWSCWERYVTIHLKHLQ